MAASCRRRFDAASALRLCSMAVANTESTKFRNADGLRATCQAPPRSRFEQRIVPLELERVDEQTADQSSSLLACSSRRSVAIEHNNMKDTYLGDQTSPHP